MNTRTKIYFWGSEAILCIGLILYALILLYTNKNFNPIEVSVDSSLIEQRLYLRNLAEKICSFFLTIYKYGQILLVFDIIKNRYRLSAKKLFGCFIFQVILGLMSVFPFAIFDLSFLDDYIFPIRGLAIFVFGLYIVLYIIMFRKNLIQKRKR